MTRTPLDNRQAIRDGRASRQSGPPKKVDDGAHARRAQQIRVHHKAVIVFDRDRLPRHRQELRLPQRPPVGAGERGRDTASAGREGTSSVCVASVAARTLS